MAADRLLKPTIHVEVLIKGDELTSRVSTEIRQAVTDRLLENYEDVSVGQEVDGFGGIAHEARLNCVEIVDYTGTESLMGFYNLQDVQLDVQVYVLKKTEARRAIKQTGEDVTAQAEVKALPSADLHNDWNSLIYDDALPARLLRYLVRMTSMMSQPGLNLATFNWNRLCLLHGPAGSGKSTLCRALAQKLSIRLGGVFARSNLVEINANAMLSKYFGESGKLILATFDGVTKMAEDRKSLICVVIDEVETIAGSRDRSASGNECRDGLRATNQLLIALDRLRHLSNVVVLCTSNLIEAIDPAFLDRVDIKQLIPSPSPAAIYNIFRSCLNELIRSSLVDASSQSPAKRSLPNGHASTSPVKASKRPKTRSSRLIPRTPSPAAPPPQSSPESWTMISSETIPSFSEMKVREVAHPNSPGSRVWALAQQCEGFSGRTLRRLPILGLAMYTWGGNCSLHDAVSALEAAVKQEVMAMKGGKAVVDAG